MFKIKLSKGGIVAAFSKLISIGVPVRNNVTTIRNTLDSIEIQSIRNCEVLISVDSSHDGTLEICQEFIERNPTWKVVNHLEKLGLYKNFEYVLKNTNSKYFLWLAGDDSISVDFLEKNVDFLEKNVDFVASSGIPVFASGSEPYRPQTINLSGNQKERILNFLRNAGTSHNVFYSVARREEMKKFRYLGKSFGAADWSYNLQLIGAGKVKTNCETNIFFGVNGVSRQKNARVAFANNAVERLFPYLRFMLTLFRKLIELRIFSKKILFWILKYSLRDLMVSCKGKLKLLI